ncbi:MAG TPA: hypothetical protein VKO63_06055, partial [Chitinispirillaceae bacterium]|nr:hypothetical protein [Chitinispirillaceae bacterium]
MRNFIIAFFFLFTTNLFADAISLFDWGVNINGTVSRSVTGLPDNIVFSNDFFETGLGTITMTFKPAVTEHYSVAMFFDYEIDEQT